MHWEHVSNKLFQQPWAFFTKSNNNLLFFKSKTPLDSLQSLYKKTQSCLICLFNYLHKNPKEPLASYQVLEIIIIYSDKRKHCLHYFKLTIIQLHRKARKLRSNAVILSWATPLIIFLLTIFKVQAEESLKWNLSIFECHFFF